MSSNQTVRLAQPSFDAQEIARVVSVLESGNLVQGEQVAAFEQAVARYLGVAHAVACSSGTAALHLAMLALNLSPGDEVIIPDFTFPATLNMVEAVGAKPVVVDIDPQTFNIQVEGVARAITPRTKAIMPVHLFGLMADMGPLLELGRQHNIPVVEDAACALGARWTAPGDAQSHGVGHGSLMACLSFHPRKLITTGEGGMIVTDDARVAAELRRLRNHGAVPLNGRMQFEQVGYNYRMMELQGALGVLQLNKLDGFIAHRQHIADVYARELRGLPVTLPTVPPGFSHVYQAYGVVLPLQFSRDRVIDALRAQGAESTIGTYALHAQPYYATRLGLNSAQFPHSSVAYHQGLVLPIHNRVLEADAIRVASTLRLILEEMRLEDLQRGEMQA